MRQSMKPLSLVAFGVLPWTSLCLARGGPNAGPDLIAGDLPVMQQPGRVGSVVGLSVSSDVCNKGNAPVNWTNLPNVNHPVQTHNLYRLKNDRFEHIGQSWVFHQFNALQANLCGFGCSANCCIDPCPAGSVLCGGCSSSTSIATAGSATFLGSRAWIQPFTGALPSNANDHTGHTHDGISHRIQVDDADLAQNMNQNNTAQYFAEVQYVSQHEYLANNGVANNQFNNASYRRFMVAGNAGGAYVFAAAAATVTEQPALNAWSGATIVAIEPSPGVDGRAYLAYKVTNLGGGQWHYEYALYNMNVDRSFRTFEVPLGNLTPTSLGFHAPMNHAGFANDGTGGAGYSNVPWTFAAGARSTETFAANPNANAVRWGTLYNFRFDANVAPRMGNITLGLFKPGTPESVVVAALVPNVCPADMNASGTVDVDDLIAVILSWGASGGPADINGDGTVNVDDLIAVILAWGPCA